MECAWEPSRGSPSSLTSGTETNCSTTCETKTSQTRFFAASNKRCSVPAVRVDESKNKVSFQNWHKQLPAPYIIYADFEALTTKIAGRELDPSKSITQRTQQHEACGFGYIVVRYDGYAKPPVIYRGLDAAERLLCALQEEEKKIKAILANPKTMKNNDTRRQASSQHGNHLPHVQQSPTSRIPLQRPRPSPRHREVQRGSK